MGTARGWSERFITDWPSALSSETPPGAESVRTITAREMIEMTASGVGQREDVDDRRIDVVVHDVSDGIAGATVGCALYVDLLQLLKTREGWRIVNVAWRRRAAQSVVG